MNSDLITVVVPRRGINDEGKGKKYALLHLVEAAHTEYVWLQDDDIQQPSISMEEMTLVLCTLSYPDLLILPLRMTAGNGSLVERLQQAEYAAIQQLTVQTAAKGRAVMCSGANMIVKRQRWLESYSHLHPDLPSGDDMFLLESFKQRGLRIAVYDAPQAEAMIKPCRTLSEMFRQRMRWAGKAGEYKDRDIRLCGAVVLIANMCQLMCPLLILLKFPFEYMLIRKRDKTIGFALALLLEILYPLYVLTCLIGGVVKKRRQNTTTF